MTEHPFLGPLELVADGEPTLLFCENETNDRAALRLAARDAVPEGRDQRSRRRGAPTVARPSRDEGRLLAPGHRRARRDRDAPRAPPPAGGSGDDPVADFDAVLRSDGWPRRTSSTAS